MMLLTIAVLGSEVLNCSLELTKNNKLINNLTNIY